MSNEKTVELVCGVRAGVPTLTGRVYPPEVLGAMVAKINEKGPQRRLLGRLGQGSSGEPVSMTEASHLVLGAKMVGGLDDSWVVVEIEPLDTPKGKLLREWIRSTKERPWVLPAGVGSVADDGTVGPDYQLTSMDVVPPEHDGRMP